MDFLGNLLGKKQEVLVPPVPPIEPVEPTLNPVGPYGEIGSRPALGPTFHEDMENYKYNLLPKYQREMSTYKMKLAEYQEKLRKQSARQGGSRRRVKSRKQRKNKRRSLRR